VPILLDGSLGDRFEEEKADRSMVWGVGDLISRRWEQGIGHKIWCGVWSIPWETAIKL
jgi:hypothetical protein